MKEIGKLIELLNEYDPYIASDGEHRDNLWGYAYQGHSAVFPKEIAESYIISKSYGFIKWLVENEKVNPYDPSYNVPTHIALGVDDGDGDFMVYERFFKEEELLMLLSIQDEPIKFLISILK